MARNQDPLNLSMETDGTVLVKFFFQSRQAFPSAIPQRADGHAFKVVGGQRKDSGTKVLEGHVVGAEFLRTGLANADGHQWKLVNVCWWKQPVTNPKARELYGDEQFVVQLSYRANPKEDDIWYLPPSVLRAVRDLARIDSWHVVVWHNDQGPATINFTSPTDAPAQRHIVIRDGCVVLVKLPQRPAEGTGQGQAAAA